MAPLYNILVLNIGSTTIKVALFENERPKIKETIAHDPEHAGLPEQDAAHYFLYKNKIDQFLKKHKIDAGRLDMIVSRGGLTAPLCSGVYLVDQKMCDDLGAGKYGRHPSNLGPVIARDLAQSAGIRAVIVDSPATDEYHPLARISGTPEIERKSAFHALNQKAAARKAAAELGILYQDSSMVVAHLGGGITVGAHLKGKVIDSTIGVGEGAMTPERAGTLPVMDLLRITQSGRLSPADLRRRLTSRGGLRAYLGTGDVKQIEANIRRGDERSLLILEAMAYQIAKDIGAMSTVLHGSIDAIVLTGGSANATLLVDAIKSRVRFMAPVMVFPGENEMPALAQGALRALSGTETIQQYPPIS